MNLLYKLAILLLLIVVADIIYWFYITGQYETFEQMVVAYEQTFPKPLQNARLLTAICIVQLTISLLIFIKAVTVNYYEKASLALSIFTGLLLGWQFFSLM